MLGQTAPRPQPATTRVVALGECTLALLPLATLREIEMNAPATALAVYRQFAARLEARLAPAVAA